MENNTEGGSLKSKMLKAVAFTGGAAIVVAAARGGLLSARPEDYQGPVNTIEVKHEPNPYMKKPVVDGYAPTINGDIIEINGISVNPDRQVEDQYYNIQGSKEKILVFENPNTSSRPIPADSLKEYGIDLSKPTLGQPVFGEPYGELNSEDNLLGNKQVDSVTKAGEYWELKGENAQGQKITTYLDIASSQVISPTPIIKATVGE